MKLPRKLLQIVLVSALLATAVLLLLVWIYSPLILYAWLAIMAVGMVYGGYMQRHWIKLQIDSEIDKYHQRQLEDAMEEEAVKRSE